MPISKVLDITRYVNKNTTYCPTFVRRVQNYFVNSRDIFSTSGEHSSILDDHAFDVHPADAAAPAQAEQHLWRALDPVAVALAGGRRHLPAIRAAVHPHARDEDRVRHARLLPPLCGRIDRPLRGGRVLLLRREEDDDADGRAGQEADGDA